MFKIFFKIYIIMVIIILFGFGLNGCSQKEPGRYYIKDEGFSIKFPDKWEIKEGFMGTAVLALSQQEGPADIFQENVNVVVEQLAGKSSIEEYLQINLTNMRKLLTDFEEYKKGELYWLYFTSGNFGNPCGYSKLFF